MRRSADRRNSGIVAITRSAALMCAACIVAGCQELEDWKAKAGAAEAEAAAAGPVYDSHRIIFPAAGMPAIELPDRTSRSIGSLLNIDRPLHYGDFVWKPDAVPAGKTWLLVDLKAQTISVFAGKHEIGTAVTLYGVDEKPTPTGRFTVLEKRKDHRSNLYDAPMPYMLRLTMDGVAIHGSNVREGAGTHGCLGVPLDFGRHLFEQVEVGDEVVIVRDAATRLRTPAEVT